MYLLDSVIDFDGGRFVGNSATGGYGDGPYTDEHGGAGGSGGDGSGGAIYARQSGSGEDMSAAD